MTGRGRRSVQHIMGMPISVDVRDLGDGRHAERALETVFIWLRWVDSTFSTYQVDSEVSRLSRGELSLADCSPEVAGVLELCRRAAADSGGFFDAWANPARSLDPSGMVKGWAIERASTLLVEAGSTNHCINAAGDIRLRGEPEPGRPWQIGVSHPQHRRALTTVIAGTDLAVATSGTAERGLHVFDPHTGCAADALASVTVVGPELIWTDAYATAALAMGLDAPEWLRSLADHEAYVIDTGGFAWWTPGFERWSPMLASATPDNHNT
jgi:thiamine biosynthesis lipoprotein